MSNFKHSKFAQKTLSVLLSTCLVAGFLPSGALAQSGDGQSSVASENGSVNMTGEMSDGTNGSANSGNDAAAGLAAASDNVDADDSASNALNDGAGGADRMASLSLADVAQSDEEGEGEALSTMGGTLSDADASTETPDITYKAHVASIGWQSSVKNGAAAGTTGKALALEALTVTLPDTTSGNILVQAHVAQIGWQKGVASGKTAGTTGQALPMEALKITLTGNLAERYDVVYRAHVSGDGWQDWKRNGEVAGTTGRALAMEAVEIMIIEKTPFNAQMTVSGSTMTVAPDYSDKEAKFTLPSCCASGNAVLVGTDGDKEFYLGESNVPLSSKPTLSSVATFVGGQEWAVDVKDEDGNLLSTVPFEILTGASSMFITSSDPVNKGRAYIEGSDDHSTEASGTVAMYNESGSCVYDGKLSQIKGRGNSTWLASKKPYQIKLDKKTDLLETGDSANKAKKWVLLANALDSSSVRSALASELGLSMDETSTLQYKYVNLYYDGEYRGLYILSEKVEVGSGRVDITDMEDETEVTDETLEVGRNDYGNEICYSRGVTNPSDITGGYLFEFDPSRYVGETAWFSVRTQAGLLHFVSKSPELWSYEQANYLSCRVQEAIDCLEAGGTNSSTGLKASDYFDMNSLSMMYLLNEFSKNRDAFVYSSTYFYKDAGKDAVIYSGPAWDFDLAFGNTTMMEKTTYITTDGWYTSSSYLGQSLFSTEAFFKTVSENLNTLLDSVQGLLDNWFGEPEEAVLPSVEYDNDMWKRTSNVENKIASVKNWISNRLNWIKNNSMSTDGAVVHGWAHAKAGASYGSNLSGEFGTTGQSRTLDSVSATLVNCESGGIAYNAHIAYVGWKASTTDQGKWKKDGQLVGQSGSGNSIEAVQFSLYGDVAETYDVYYRAHVSNIGWMNWAKNGEIAGTTGLNYGIESIQLVLVKKGETVDGITQNATTVKYGGAVSVATSACAPQITCKSHVQNVGWQDKAYDGGVSGTSGQALRLEAVRVELGDAVAQLGGSVRYKSHVQNIGWQDWVDDGGVSGTSGQSLRLEAVKIELTGNVADAYDIYYRVHVQNIGWMGWAKDGEMAGTSGMSYRLEAIQVLLVPKGQTLTGVTSGATEISYQGIKSVTESSFKEL